MFRLLQKIIIITFLSFAVLLLILQIPSLNTPVAQGIINIVTPRDMYIRIKGVHGTFPFDVTIDKIKIKDKKSGWLEIEAAALEWQGVDILYGNIHFPKISARKVVYWREPDMEISDDPFRLPRLNIDKIFVEAVKIPSLYVGSFQADGKIQSPDKEHHHAQVDLRFSDNPDHVETIMYDQQGINYTLKGKVDRPVHLFSKLSPDNFENIKSGQVLFDLDIQGDTYFRTITGKARGELLNFKTSDEKIQDILGGNPKVILNIDADDKGIVRKAVGALTLGEKRELSFTALPDDINKPNFYNLVVNLKTQKQKGQVDGKVFLKDAEMLFKELHLTGLGSDVRGDIVRGKNWSVNLKGKIHDLYPLSDLIDYPVWGQADLDIVYAPQELTATLISKSILLQDNKTPIEKLELTSKVLKGQGSITVNFKRAETIIEAEVGVQDDWQKFELHKLLLTEAKSPIIYLNKPFYVLYKDNELSIPSAEIKCLDGRLLIQNLEISQQPKGEVLLDKVTAKILNPLIDDVKWQGEANGKLSFHADPKKGYYSGFLKIRDFGTANKLRKTQKLINFDTQFLHSGTALTVDLSYTDSTTSLVKGKAQVSTTSLWPQNTDLLKTSIVGALDLSSLNALIWWGDRFKGKLIINHTGQGTFLVPNFRGNFKLDNGYYENAAIGAVLKDVNGQASFANQKLIISSFGGRDYDKGIFNLKGSANFTEFLSPTLDLHLTFNKLIVANTEEAIISATGKLDASTMSPHHHLLNGSLKVNSALINLTQVTSEPQTIRTFRTQQELEQKQSKVYEELKTSIDINIDIPKKLLIQGYGLRSEWKGQLSVKGAINSPIIEGAINSMSGRLNIASKRLGLAPSSVTFNTHNGQITPVLDIKAGKEVGEYDAFIALSGPSNNPKIEFISLPALPTEDVIALILFDKPLGQVSAAQSLQLATTIAALKAGNFKGGTFDSLNQLLGVDDISLQQAEVSEAVDDDKSSYNLSVGKQLSKKVYVGIEQGLQENVGTKLKMKVDVTKKTKLDIETGTENSAIGYGWEFRY